MLTRNWYIYFFITLFKTSYCTKTTTVVFLIISHYDSVLRIFVVIAIYVKLELMTDKKLSKAVLN